MKNELINEKDKLLGKAKEMTGKILDNDKMEWKGKVIQAKAEIKDKIDDMKDDVYEKANDIIDIGKEMKDKMK